jgi:hypothetical protein
MFTESQDRLPALSGLAKASLSTRGIYLAGIWERHLPQALYWTPSVTEETSSTRPLQYRAPSFSWASVDCHVLYHRWRPNADVDDALHQSLRQGHIMAKVIDSKCTPDGLDPHGRVKDGYIDFHGWIGTAFVSRIYNKGAVTICELKTGALSHRFALDIPLAHQTALGQHIQKNHHATSANSETPAETKLNDTVTLLLVECEKILGGAYFDSIGHYRVAALALRPSPRVPRAYERIGLVFAPQQPKYVNIDDEDYDLLVGDLFKFAPSWFDEKSNIKVV